MSSSSTHAGASRKIIAVLMILGGAGIAAFAMRGDARRSEEAESIRVETAAAKEALSQRLITERRTMEARTLDAAATKPLNAALENHVDGPTLMDLFDNEDWWRPYREQYAATRVIVGDFLFAAQGKLDLGVNDKPVVKEARQNKVASAAVNIGGTLYLIGAAKMPSLGNKEPVLVLARKSPVDPAAPIATRAPSEPARQPIEGMMFWGGAAALAVVGLLLLVTGGRRGGQPPVAGAVPHEDTLKFGGTPGRPQMRVESKVLNVASPVGTTASGAAAPAVGLATGAGSLPSVPMTMRGSRPLSDVAPGTLFGRYKLLDRLGEGGMSEIFTAVAYGVEGFSRTFVLKRLRPELARDKEAVAQFIDEARMQASLVHSNIVPVFDFGMVGDEYFMTQEYIVGRDVVRLMTRYYEKTKRALDHRLAYYIAHETLQALTYAHNKRERDGSPMGIVHRDVSAANVMVSLQGEVKLFDFGIVKSNRRVTKTQVGMVKGNANFMSPEQARGHTVDGRSDLFSLALVLYYTLTNELFYDGDNDLEVLYQAATGPTAEGYRKIRALPEPAAQILEKALAIDPAQRFQTADEFGAMLAAHIGGGKADAGNLMQLLFGEELGREAA
ncbi:MAG TPA: serine/threonine-protein kinase [Polyangia bacterium]|jgi:hypothetical protein|nr:serine/threonine-protein kinase [Polyangia bacterium]